MLPVSQEMLEIVRSFIDKTYSSLCSTNDLPFRANAVEVYPKSEGGYSVLLYKTQPPVGGDLDKVFEYNTDPTSNKAYMDFCKGLEKYINGLDEYKYFKFQVIPGRKLTKQVVNFIIYPEHKFDKPTPEDLEKFDIKELTKDSRLKQNESADPAESDRLKESFDPAEEAFLNGTPYCPDYYDDDDVDDEGYDAGGHYVGAEDDAIVADFIRDQAKDEMFESIKEDATDNAFKQGYRDAYHDEHISVRLRTPNPFKDAPSQAAWNDGYRKGMKDLEAGTYKKSIIFESVLAECDGGACSGDGDCTCASDFSGQVPENMGAVVGPGKNDKKFSDIFGD